MAKQNQPPGSTTPTILFQKQLPYSEPNITWRPQNWFLPLHPYLQVTNLQLSSAFFFLSPHTIRHHKSSRIYRGPRKYVDNITGSACPVLGFYNFHIYTLYNTYIYIHRLTLTRRRFPHHTYGQPPTCALTFAVLTLVTMHLKTRPDPANPP